MKFDKKIASEQFNEIFSTSIDWTKLSTAELKELGDVVQYLPDLMLTVTTSKVKEVARKKVAQAAAKGSSMTDDIIDYVAKKLREKTKGGE